MFPRRPFTRALVLLALVLLGLLGFGGALATAADVLLWLLIAWGVVLLVRGLWRRLTA